MVILISIIVILLGVWVVGMLLPKQRVATRQSIFNVSAKQLFDIVVDNENWQYRSDLKELNIIERKDSVEIWEEVSLDGNVIRFKTKEKRPYSYYSFDMESSVMKGYWLGEFKEINKTQTLFTATEFIEMKNPFLKVLSYLFFDIGKFMETYQKDLQKKTMRVNENS